MKFIFSDNDIEAISEILNSKPDTFESGKTWSLQNSNNKQSLVFTIYNDVNLGDNTKGSLVTVQTTHGYFELHNITNYLIFEPDEIIFIQANDTFLSSLIIGKECTCSLFSNINRDILNSDFSTLDPAVLLSAMQLSITETTLPEKVS